MKRDQLIHSTLSQIDWGFVQTAFKQLDLPWYEKKTPSKTDIVNDLVSLINNAFENPEVEIVTEYWNVYYDPNSETLEVSFTPIAITNSSNDKLTKRIEELKSRIELHTQLEEYERCFKYKKQLDKLQKQLDKI